MKKVNKKQIKNNNTTLVPINKDDNNWISASY